jgi:biopolymer transport protein ExbD
MNFQSGGFRRQPRQVTLDLTPLIDCIFQLLVFFLLTASFITTPNLGVDLPKASAKATTSQQRDLVVSITREGEILLGGEKVDSASLLTELRARQRKNPDSRVLIQADKRAYHGDVVRAMDSAKAAGFRRLGVAIQQR